MATHLSERPDPKTLQVLAGLSLLLLLTSCGAPQSVAYDTYAGSPPGYEGAGGAMNGQPGAVWMAGKREFAIVTFGSSSCPPTATRIEAEPPSTVVVEFSPSTQDPCTADLAPTTFEFRVPSGIEVDAPVTVLTRFLFDQTYEYELVLD